MNTWIVRVANLAMAPLVIAGCVSEDSAAVDEPTSVAEPILNGTTVGTDVVGTILLGNCSGTLLRNTWVMTAKHCGAAAGNTVWTASGSPATVGAVFNHPTQDVALLKLNSPLSAGQGPYPLYRGPKSKLLNQSLNCRGYGNSQCTDVPTQTGCTGFGTLRSAVLPVTEINWNGIKLTPNGSGQIQLAGDSGSSCFTSVLDPNRRKWTGVDCCTGTGAIGSEMWFTAPDMFRDWANGIIGSAPTSGANAGFERSDTITAVYYRNGSSIRELAKGDGSWGVATLPASSSNAASNPGAVVRVDGWSSVVYRGSNNHIHVAELFPGGSWVSNDLSNLVSGDPDAKGNPAAYGRSDRVAAIVYRGSDDHVHELSLVEGASWGYGSLTGALGTTWKASADPIGYVREDGSNAVVYRSSDGHIRELSLPLGSGAWSNVDLHVATSAFSPATAVGTPRPYTRADGVSAIVYRTSGGDLWEMARPSGGAWQAFRLVQGGVTSDPVGYVRGDGYNVVVYRGSNGHIYEVALVGSSWIVTDLHSIATNAPAVSGLASGWPNAFVRGDRASSIVFRPSTSDQIWELRLVIGGNWVASNLTQEAGGTF